VNREMMEIIRTQTPLTLTPGTSVKVACARMHDRKVGAVLVTDQRGALLGIFTGRDAVRVLANGWSATETLLEQVMTTDLATMSPRGTAIEALRLMRDGGFRHVPVVDSGVVVGVVSRGDFRGLEQDRMEEETEIWERIG
jgi:CBS domain-containing protein